MSKKHEIRGQIVDVLNAPGQEVQEQEQKKPTRTSIVANVDETFESKKANMGANMGVNM